MDATPSEFEVRTKAELIRLATEAKAAWPSHNCPEGAGACRHCTAHRTLHARINDHIDQLRGDDAEYTPAQIAALQVAAREKVEFHQAPECGMCGRFRHAVDDKWLICLDCDAARLPSLGLGQ